MREYTRRRIITLHNRGQSIYGIAVRLGINSWTAQEVINHELELEKEVKELYNEI